jgi:signal transduction histidine kinase/ligand-binding sensor domain-containing protein
MRFSFIFLTLLLFTCNPARECSAQNFRIRYYSPRIHNGSITNILQDSQGILWYTTQEGIYSYNGKTSALIDKGSYKNILEISPTEILGVASQKILRIRPPGDTSQVVLPKSASSEDDIILQSVASADGNAIFLTATGLFHYSRGTLTKLKLLSYRYSPDHFRLFFASGHFKIFTPTEMFSCETNGKSFVLERSFQEKLLVYNIISDTTENEKYILFTDRGPLALTGNKLTRPLWRGLPEKFQFSEARYFKKYILVSSTAHGFWIGKKSTRGGFTFSPMMDGSEPHRTLNLPFSAVRKFSISPDRNIWVLHEKGLSLMQETPFSKISNDVPMASFDRHAITPDGTVYLESDNGIFECRKNDVGDYVGGVSEVGSHLIIPSIAAIDERIWLATVNYDLIYYENNIYHKVFNFKDRGHTLFTLYSDKRKNLWIMQAPGRKPIVGVLKVTPDLKLIDYNETKGFESRMLSIKESSNGMLFCSGIGENSYLYRYDRASDRFENVSAPLLFDFGDNFEVHDLAVGNDTTVWLASTAGLLKYHRGKVEKVNLEEFFGNEAVSVDIGTNGEVWISTNLNGIMKIKDGEDTNFDQYSGLASSAMTYRSISIKPDGYVWTGTEEGFYISAPEARPVRKTHRPILLTINNEAPTQKTFAYHSDLSFDFISPTFPVETVVYAYRLAGFNNNRWTKLSQLDTLLLTNLEDGRYELEIRARQRGGYQWSDALSVNFQIERVWYAQTPAVIAYILFGSLLFAGGVRVYNNHLLRDKRTLELKVLDRTSEITQKNNEITAQMEELKQLSDEIASQRDNIEYQNSQLAKAKSNLEQKVSERTIELSKANAELTDQNIQLEQFTFMTAHNLRAPIARLIGLTQIFNFENPADPINTEVVRRISHSVRDLDEVVHDISTILQVKKSLNGSFSVINLSEMVQNVLRSFPAEIENKNIRIVINVRQNISIQGIEAYVFSVLHNVISNSIKYSSRKDTPLIEIKATEVNDKVELKISDNGIGFDLRQQPDKLFKPFSRFHADGEGKGLGLYMIKIQMESMQGAVDIQSVVDLGTSVTLVFRNALILVATTP